MRVGRIYNSGVIFHVAERAYERTGQAPSDREPHQQDALVAIVFSVAALEAFINESAEYAQGAVQSWPDEPAYVRTFAEVMNEVEKSRGSIQLKYLIAKWILTEQPYDPGTQPYQDFDLLLGLRNALVHLRPLDRIERSPDHPVAELIPAPIIEKLRSKNILGEYPPSIAAPWINHICTRAVARWACNVTVAMVRSVLEGAPECRFKETTEFFASNSFRPVS